ncbi:MAG: hypothetical protein ABW201_18985 [Candidatus Thiodiazotropha sp.]
MPLFDVAILERPTKKEAEEGQRERIVLGSVSVVAADEQSAAISAVMDSTEKEIKVDRARMVVLARPFG